MEKHVLNIPNNVKEVYRPFTARELRKLKLMRKRIRFIKGDNYNIDLYPIEKVIKNGDGVCVQLKWLDARYTNEELLALWAFEDGRPLGIKVREEPIRREYGENM